MKTVEFTGMPRSMRTRLLKPRKKAAAKAPAATAMEPPQQDMAVSMSGKTALGPWLGPYMPLSPAEAEEEAPSSPTIYVKYSGRVFADLEGAPVLHEEGAEGGHPGALAALPTSPRQRKDHSKELRMMNSKGVNKQAAPKGTAFSRGLRRTRMINQPKTGF